MKRKAAGVKGRKAVLVRLRSKDTPYGVTHTTLQKLAKSMNLNVSDVVHVALAECARANLPRYEVDEGALTREHHGRIAELTRGTRATYRETDSLFGEGNTPDNNNAVEQVRDVSGSR